MRRKNSRRSIRRKEDENGKNKSKVQLHQNETQNAQSEFLVDTNVSMKHFFFIHKSLQLNILFISLILGLPF